MTSSTYGRLPGGTPSTYRTGEESPAGIDQRTIGFIKTSASAFESSAPRGNSDRFIGALPGLSVDCGLPPIPTVEQEHPWLWLLYAAGFVAVVALSALYA